MAENSYRSAIRLKQRRLKSFLFSKDVLSFLLFLLLSALFWFVNALDKNREISLRIPLQIKNLPERVALTTPIPEFITVDVSDVGVNLFAYSDSKIKPLHFSLANFRFAEKGEMIIDAASINRHLQSYLLPTSRILAFRPDSIIIRYQKLAEKKLPVKLMANIETERQYMITGKVTIQPSSLIVYGPAHILDTLQWVETEQVELNNLKDTLVVNLKIKPIPFVKPEANTVKVTVPVVMFTEKTIELPVDAVNFPLYLKLKSFPALVKANFNIAITEFQTFKTDDIQVYVDYNDLQGNKNPKYKLKINIKNQHINNIRLSPSEVEYILEQD